MRFTIWRNTLVAVALYVIAIYAADRWLFSRLAIQHPLAVALSFASVQVTIIIVMLLLLFGWKRRDVLRSARSEQLAPQIEEALALHSIGDDQSDSLRRLRDLSRYDVREKLFAVAATTRGDARDRMATLALDLQLVERGADAELRTIRDYIRVSHGRDFEGVVQWSARRPLIARAIIADEYTSYAGEVSDEQLVAALNADDRGVVLATLEMLLAWRRTVRIPGFTMLLANADPRVRERAFKALSYVAAGHPPEVVASAIAAGLRADDVRVRRSAALAAGRMHVVSMATALAERLGDADREVAVAAAWALASFGDKGLAVLEQSLQSENRIAAEVAFEMWEKTAIGRLAPA